MIYSKIYNSTPPSYSAPPHILNTFITLWRTIVSLVIILYKFYDKIFKIFKKSLTYNSTLWRTIKGWRNIVSFRVIRFKINY